MPLTCVTKALFFFFVFHNTKQSLEEKRKGLATVCETCKISMILYA